MAGVQTKETVLEVCITAQNEDLSAAEFDALAYIEICCVRELPEFGSEVEFLSEHCIDGTELTGVGFSSGAETETTYTYMASCEAQNFLRNNAKSRDSFAMRKVYPDGTASTTPTTIYTRARIGGWMDGGGDGEGFHTHTVTFKLSQDPVFVVPAAI